MKIALLSEKYTPDVGGLAISTKRFARLLLSVGYETRVFAPTLSLHPSEKRTLTHSGVSVTRFGAHKRVDDTLVDWFELIVDEHKREPFNILHAYFLTQAGFVATYAGKYLNIPSVVSMRGNDIDRAAFDPSKFSQVMYALQNANAITTNANELARKAKAFVEGREVIVIPNGVDTEHFKPMEKNEELIKTLGLNHAPGGGLSNLPIVGFVGELREKKGLKTLLSAYAQTNKQLQASLLIVGVVRAGEDKKTFDEFVQANPHAKIVVTGYVSPNDLPAYYSLIDVLLHPSLHDGMPNALLEAMACGKPVVATPVGGIVDVVKNGENGILIPVNNEEALTSAIVGLLSDATLRKKLGISARQTIVEKFTPQMELQANLSLYRKLGQAL